MLISQSVTCSGKCVLRLPKSAENRGGRSSSTFKPCCPRCASVTCRPAGCTGTGLVGANTTTQEVSGRNADRPTDPQNQSAAEPDEPATPGTLSRVRASCYTLLQSSHDPLSWCGSLAHVWNSSGPNAGRFLGPALLLLPPFTNTACKSSPFGLECATFLGGAVVPTGLA